MSDFLVVLAFYYACDAAAIDGRLQASEIVRCSLAYESAKTHFLSAEERATLGQVRGRARADLMREAHLRFAAWEDDHEHLVRDLRKGKVPAIY